MRACVVCVTKIEEFTDICRIAIVLKGELLLFKNWTNRDWLWTTGILIGIIITSFAFFLSENNRVVEIFSFLASGVSIALAFVAIYVSSNQNKESQSLSQNMSETLARMDEKVRSINEKVDKFDFKPLLQDTERKITEIISATGNDSEDVIGEVKGMVSKEFEKLNQEIDTKLSLKSKNTVDYNKMVEKYKRYLLNMGSNLNNLSLQDIKLWAKEDGRKLTSIILSMALGRLVSEGYVTKNVDGTYSRVIST